jgi:hypothetical protein
MNSDTRTMTRKEAIEFFGVHYEAALPRLQLSRSVPQTPAQKLEKLADFDVTGKAVIVEALGQAQESFHYRSVKDAADSLLTAQQQSYAQRRDALRDALNQQETKDLVAAEAALDKNAPKPMTDAFNKAAATINAIDRALEAGIKVEMLPLKEQLRVPAHILNDGQEVQVLRGTDGIPQLTAEHIRKREITTPLFACQYDVSIIYTVGDKDGPVPQKNSTHFAMAHSPHDKDPANMYAAGKNMMVFAYAADAKRALQNILSDRLDHLDALKKQVSKELDKHGLKRRAKTKAPTPKNPR